MKKTNLEKTLDIIAEMKRKGIKKVSLGFSTGKDSVFGMHILQANGIEVIPFYHYIIPDIKFIETNIQMYEDFFQTKIIRLPHPMLNDYIKYTYFQPLHKAANMSRYGTKHMGFQDIEQWYFKEAGLAPVEYDSNCMKMADSLNRRLMLRNRPDIDEARKIVYIGKYIIDSEIWAYFKENNVPVTKDYEIFGRSADDLLNYQYLSGIKKHYPEDYATILEYFPLAEVELLRYKAYLKHYKQK